MSKSALVISFSPLNSDPRVRRQIGFLTRMGFCVTAIGTESPMMDGVVFHSSVTGKSWKWTKALLALNLLGKNFERYYWKKDQVRCAFKKVYGIHFDLIVANDVDTLPLALKLAENGQGKIKVLFDAHEYAPREFEEKLSWRVLFKDYVHELCTKYLLRADAMITVCQGIAEEYEANYGVRPSIITNASAYIPLSPSPVNEKRIKMIYHGLALPSRKVEDLVTIMNATDERYELDIILVPGCRKYIRRIRSLARSCPKISFLEPVKTAEIPLFCNQYDIGIYPLYPSNYNNLHSLPNKFFEYIQARTAIAVTPLPEMSRFIQHYSCGMVSRDFNPKTFADQLNSLTCEEIRVMKQNTNVAAEKLCSEENFKTMKSIISALYNQ